MPKTFRFREEGGGPVLALSIGVEEADGLVTLRFEPRMAGVGFGPRIARKIAREILRAARQAEAQEGGDDDGR